MIGRLLCSTTMRTGEPRARRGVDARRALDGSTGLSDAYRLQSLDTSASALNSSDDDRLADIERHQILADLQWSVIRCPRLSDQIFGAG